MEKKMFTLLRSGAQARPTDRLANELMDGLENRRPRRVLAVGDEAERVAKVLRERLPGATVIAVHEVAALEHWGGWAELIVSAWSDGIDAPALVARLHGAAALGSTVAVLDRGAIDLVDALQRTFAAVDWTIERPTTGGEPILRFVGRTAA